MSLKDRTISGVSWSVLARFGKQGLNLVVTVILMRMLDPEAYGLIAMAMVLIGFASMFRKFGLGSAIIQQKNVTELQSSSLFWSNLFVGTALTAGFIVAAPYAVQFFDASASLREIIQALSFIFVFGAAGVVPRSFLKKEMRFDLLARVDVLSMALAGPLALVLAFTGWGVWSLVIKNIVSTLAASILAWIYYPWCPRLSFSFSKIKNLLLYGANFTGFKFINKFARAGDDLLIGRFMDAASLGVYSQAYKIMMLPIGKGIGSVSDVLFPALSSIQDDQDRVRSVFLRTVRLVSLIIFPVMMGLLVTADHFVISFFGRKWSEIIPVLRIFSAVGILQTLTRPTGWIYQSQGRADWMFRWGLFGSSTLIIGIVVGVVIGNIEAVAWGYLVANIVLVYPALLIPGWLINMTFLDVVKSVHRVLISALVMAMVLFFVGEVLPSKWPSWALLAIHVVFGSFVYFLTAKIIAKKAFADAKESVSDQLSVMYT